MVPMSALVAAALIIIGILALTHTWVTFTFLGIASLVAGVLLLAGVVSSGALRWPRKQ